SSSLFTGQEEYLDKLRHHFNDLGNSMQRKLYLLHGPGGIGKTQICLKFKEEIEDEVSYIFWIDASSEATIISSFMAIARHTDICGKQSGLSVGQSLQAIQTMKEKWLMI
ncbi:hypothetical protein AMATHDRAFT_118823, partial [Amanita thiersii Skay4041]